MRLIKFRAWDKENKRMMIFDELWLCTEYQSISWSISKESIIETDKDNSLDCSRDLELMQFTGLLDRRGVEIYEGDIIKINGKVTAPNSHYGEEFENFEEVYFTDGRFYPASHMNYNGWKCEVLGNKFQHPHLLKESTEGK